MAVRGLGGTVLELIGLARAPAPLPAGDRALLLLARDGDERACRALLARHAVRVREIVARAHPELGSVDDVVQETFLRALREADQLRADASAFAWLVRIALRLAIDDKRRHHRERLGVVAPEPAVESATAEEALAGAEDAARVRGALERLSVHAREVVVLRYFAGLSTAEIAEATGRSEVAVRKELQRARDRLRAALEEVER